MKIKEIVFFGFNRSELRQIRRGTGKSGEEDYSEDFTQEVADIVGVDILTLIQPDGQISLIKAGE